MKKYRVTYAAAKHKNTYRDRSDGVRELLETVLTYQENTTVIVEAGSEEEAIAKATDKVPLGADISAHAHLMGERSASA